MKQLFIIFIITLASITNAALPNIVALVNNEPITSYEFQMKKKMLMSLNNVQNPNADTNRQLDRLAINSLVDEEILSQHAITIGAKISAEEIDEAIHTIEQRNKMPKGYLLNILRTQGVETSFRNQIKGELIKMNILSYLSKSVSVSPKEIDAAIFSSNSKDLRILAKVFTSLNKDDKALQKMYSLQKTLRSCENIKPSIYDKFATIDSIDQNLSTLDQTLQPIIKGLYPKESQVYENDKGYNLILVCEKRAENLTAEENNYVTNFLTNKKMSQKAEKFFDNLHKKAYIKIMLPM